MKYLLILLGLGFGAAAVLQGKGGLKGDRDKIRSHFTVSGDCQITYTGDPAKAQAFWRGFDPYLKKMIELAASIGIDYPEGIAAYVGLALFPECDQTKQKNPSFTVVLAAMEFRITQLLES